MRCAREFGNAGARAAHERTCKGRAEPQQQRPREVEQDVDSEDADPEEQDDEEPVEQQQQVVAVKKLRRTFTAKQKLLLLNYRSRMRACGATDATSRAARIYNIRTKHLNQWVRDRSSIEAAFKAHPKAEAAHVGSVAFPEEEQLLVAGVRARRATGLPVRGAWLQFEMRRLVRERFDDGGFALDMNVLERRLEFKASIGWLSGFLKRHKLVSRRATRKKNTDINLEAIRKHHALLRRRLKRHGYTGLWGE